MFSIIGIVVVLGAIVGGYLLERGNLLVLLQPAELIIIGGAGIGTLLIANPLPVLIGVGKGLLAVFMPSKYNKNFYLTTLTMLNDLFNKGRKGGISSLESDVEQPQQSELFQKYPAIAKQHHLIDFICDTLRIVMAGNISPFELDQMLELDLEVHHKEVSQPASALVTVADALPGLGIVAAVLGVVITMGSLGGPPSEIGHKVAAALVGTFLGILLCYGFFSPFAVSMGKSNECEAQYYNCLRVGLLSYIRGASPLVALEFARRSIPHAVRPTFQELEGELRGKAAEHPEQPVAA
jgi:chemotaxis protein MotA